MTTHNPEAERLRETILAALPNRDQQVADQLLAAVRPFLKQAWEDGQTDGYQGAHSSFSRYAHIERTRVNDNPWCDGNGMDCGCVFGHEDRRKLAAAGERSAVTTHEPTRQPTVRETAIRAVAELEDKLRDPSVVQYVDAVLTVVPCGDGGYCAFENGTLVRTDDGCPTHSKRPSTRPAQQGTR